VPPLSRLAQLDPGLEPDFPSIIERLKRSCGTNTLDLAAALRIQPRLLIKIEIGEREPTWGEGDLLLRALELCRRDHARPIR
jgi:ribosome-binding protein aMBF1 (putative translation factor)